MEKSFTTRDHLFEMGRPQYFTLLHSTALIRSKTFAFFHMRVSPTSHRKQSKCLTLLVRSTKKPNIYSTKAKEYRQETSSQLLLQ